MIIILHLLAIVILPQHNRDGISKSGIVCVHLLPLGNEELPTCMCGGGFALLHQKPGNVVPAPTVHQSY